MNCVRSSYLSERRTMYERARTHSLHSFEKSRPFARKVSILHRPGYTNVAAPRLKHASSAFSTRRAAARLADRVVGRTHGRRRRCRPSARSNGGSVYDRRCGRLGRHLLSFVQCVGAHEIYSSCRRSERHSSRASSWRAQCRRPATCLCGFVKRRLRGLCIDHSKRIAAFLSANPLT